MQVGRLCPAVVVLVAMVPILIAGQVYQIQENSHYEGAMVVPANANVQPSIEACYQSCRHMGDSQCNSFVWCGELNGCDDGFGLYMYQGCELQFQHAGEVAVAIQAVEGKTKLTSGLVDYSSTFERLHDPSTIQVLDNPAASRSLLQTMYGPTSDAAAPAPEAAAPEAAPEVGSKCVKDSNWTITYNNITYFCIPHSDARYCTSNRKPVGYCQFADGSCGEGDGVEGSGPCVKKADGTYDNWCC